MADEAFALSPISARSTSPTDADYEAIREAFMETSRGRWFLHEYAKRNRNADTAMVLDAVARIEQSLANTKVAAAEPEPQGPSAEELLAQVESILREARTSIVAILGEPMEIEGLTPFRRSARIIQEIAWGLRESGADVRICDLLDSQVRSINAASDALSDSGRDAVLKEIDIALLKVRQILDENAGPAAESEQDIAGTDDPVTPEAEAFVEPQTALPEVPMSIVEAPATETVEIETGDAEGVADTIESEAAEPATADIGNIDIAMAGDVAEPAVSCEACADSLTPADLAVDPSEFLSATEPPPVMAEMIAHVQVQEVSPQQETTVAAMIETTMVATNIEASLGEHLIAQGIVAQTKAPPDLLAPIRRMSQAEKIAFFS